MCCPNIIVIIDAKYISHKYSNKYIIWVKHANWRSFASTSARGTNHSLVERHYNCLPFTPCKPCMPSKRHSQYFDNLIQRSSPIWSLLLHKFSKSLFMSMNWIIEGIESLQNILEVFSQYSKPRDLFLCNPRYDWNLWSKRVNALSRGGTLLGLVSRCRSGSSVQSCKRCPIIVWILSMRLSLAFTAIGARFCVKFECFHLGFVLLSVSSHRFSSFLFRTVSRDRCYWLAPSAQTVSDCGSAGANMYLWSLGSHIIRHPFNSCH